MITCRKCGSDKVFFTKHINWGPVAGNVYHYKLHCDSCHTKYNLERCKEIYEQVKDLDWIYEKSYRKHLKELNA